MTTDPDTANAYLSLAETTGRDDPRWAFGSPGEQAPAEVRAPVPSGVDPDDLTAYCLMLGDDALVCAQRLAEWVSNAPELEEELALANIALDLLGQARALLARAGFVEGAGRDDAGRGEDALAYQRTDREFRNVALAELPDDLDFGWAVARLLLFATARLALLRRLVGSRDPVVSAVAARGVAELAYHRDYAVRWTLRLGDGTAESHRRMQAGLDRAWPYLDEVFRACPVERRLAVAGVAVDPAETRGEVDAVLDEVLARATLRRPQVPTAGLVGGLGGLGGRDGMHTEHLGHLLAELQSLARMHPGAWW